MTFPTSLPIPPEVLRIAQRLEASGYETWCVGGAVRDNLLGLENRDFDLATAAPPDVVRKLFRRNVPVGVEHGTVAVLDADGQPHEVTTFRRDVRTDGRHAVVEFGVSLEDDLARRDFTINAIAYHPARLEWRDPYDGAADLTAQVVRAVGDPVKRFREDYLRIVRGLRFAARFAFAIEPATWRAAQSEIAGIDNLSAERVRDEWFKGLATASRASVLVRLWSEVGALARWLPEVEQGVAGGDEVMAGADRLPRDPVLSTAFLATDPGATLTRLRCSNADIERARRIAACRDTLPEAESGPGLRRWLAAAGPAADDLVAIAQAQGRAAGLAEAVAEVRRSGAPLAVDDLAVSGKDVMECGFPEGPAVGEALRALLEDVLHDPSRNTRRALRARLRELAEAGDPPAGHSDTETDR